MKTIYKLLTILLLPSVLVLYSYNSGSPGGKTGSTGDNGTTCTQCHAGTAVAQTNWITSDIPSDGYTPGETYTITVTGTHSGVAKMGFEVTAENSFGNKKGTWTITESSRTKLTNSNNAVTHTSGGTAPNGDSNSWDMDWTAPAAGTGNIKFNTAVNAANGNGSTSGDQIYTSLMTVMEAVVLNPEITDVNPNKASQGWSGDVVITGNETQWLMDGVENVVFKYANDNSITLTPDNFVVNSNTIITCTFTIPADQQFGNYDVYVDDLVDNDGFEVEEVVLNPEITMVDPTHAAQGWTGMISISGSETSWTDGVSSIMIKYHDDNTIMLAAENIMVVNDTEVHADLNIPVDQLIGMYDLYVDDLMLENGFAVDILDALSETLENQISLYPVPAITTLNINLPNDSKYRIIGLDGKVYSEILDSTKTTFDLTNLSKGIYFVQVENNGQTAFKKFIKQ